MVTIRDYRKADEPQVLALVHELQAHEIALYERMKRPDEIGPWYMCEVEKLCAKHAGKIRVAQTEDGAIIGYASILTDCSSREDYDEVEFSYGYVSDLVVAGAWRGRGIGGVLLEDCERLAREAGRDELRVTVLAKNIDAHRLYRRVGFADHEVLMHKRLV
jgi:ribosomal protein S18 acetylase RimI-like enzyme